MIKKFVYGTPFETEAVVKEIPDSEGNPDYGTFSTENGFSFTTKLADDDMVFGLGEANRGINKRGFLYISDCADDPNHVESKTSVCSTQLHHHLRQDTRRILLRLSGHPAFRYRLHNFRYDDRFLRKRRSLRLHDHR